MNDAEVGVFWFLTGPAWEMSFAESGSVHGRNLLS